MYLIFTISAVKGNFGFGISAHLKFGFGIFLCLKFGFGIWRTFQIEIWIWENHWNWNLDWRKWFSLHHRSMQHKYIVRPTLSNDYFLAHFYFPSSLHWGYCNIVGVGWARAWGHINGDGERDLKFGFRFWAYLKFGFWDLWTPLTHPYSLSIMVNCICRAHDCDGTMMLICKCNWLNLGWSVYSDNSFPINKHYILRGWFHTDNIVLCTIMVRADNEHAKSV